MKSKYVMIAALATMMAGCSNDENEVNDGPVAAQVYAEIGNRAVSRATATAWQGDDRIGISTIDGTEADATKTKYANVPYIYKSSNFVFDETASGKTPIYFEDTKVVTFRAYYPYNPNVTAATTSIADISTTDQTNQENFDYMFAKGATASKSGSEVKFVNNTTISGGIDASFHHCMSQLTFVFTAGDGVTAGDLEENLKNFKIEGVVNSGSFDTTNGTAKAKESPEPTDKGITTSTFTDNNTKASVILFPQTAPIADGKFKIVLTLDGVDYSAELTLPAAPSSANGAFTAGVSVEYTITIQKTGLEVESAEITDWTKATGTGTATMG